MSLPPLPKPQWLGDIHGYTEAQMLALRAATVEACAKVCDEADKSTHPADLADAIRGME